MNEGSGTTTDPEPPPSTYNPYGSEFIMGQAGKHRVPISASQKRQFVILLGVVVITFIALGIGANRKRVHHHRPFFPQVATSSAPTGIPFVPYTGPGGLRPFPPSLAQVARVVTLALQAGTPPVDQVWGDPREVYRSPVSVPQHHVDKQAQETHDDSDDQGQHSERQHHEHDHVSSDKQHEHHDGGHEQHEHAHGGEHEHGGSHHHER